MPAFTPPAAPPPPALPPLPALPDAAATAGSVPSDATPPEPAPPAAAQDAASDAQRFQALKSDLERQGAATPPSPVRQASQPVPQAASADSGGCATTVHTRAGFHDHYGGLNSAGDVAQPCAPATASP